MHTILLAGGTGLIGQRLQMLLTSQGHTVRILSRRPKTAGQYAWDPATGALDESALDGVTAVINLAGAGIADARWTPARKRELIDSRVQSARTLREAIARRTERPQVYVSASAIGIYGDSGEAWQYENAAIEQGSNRPFMVDCCDQWEQAADGMAALGVRTVKIRIGIVLDPHGGALAEMARPLQFGLGGYFGNGQAWYSWIHRDDICRMLLWAVETPAATGVYNGVAPQPERNVDFIKKTAKALQKTALFAPAPALLMKLALGEMSAVVLNSNRVNADKVQAAGFTFLYPGLAEALSDLYGSRT